MAIIYVHPTTGNDGSGDGLSFATGYKTLGKALSVASPSDEIRLPKSDPPIATTLTGSFTNDSEDVILSSAVTKEMDSGLSAWGMGYSGLVSTTTNWGIVGLNVIQVEYNPTGGGGEPPAGANRIFWTPTVFPSYTGYEQISMVFNLRTAGSFLSGLYAGQYVYNFFEIKLCSDNAGLVPVHTIPFPTGLESFANNPFPLTIDLGTDIGAIQSIAIWTTASFPGYVSSIGEQTRWQIVNVVACKPSADVDAITHSSVITKDMLTDPRIFPVRYILGTTVKIGGGYRDTFGYNFSIGPNLIGYLSYAGTTETVSLFRYDPRNFYKDTTATAVLKRIATSISVTGGWTDETTLSTRKTWFVTSVLTSAVFSNDTSTFLEVDSNPALSILLKNVGLYGYQQGLVRTQGSGTPDVATVVTFDGCHFVCIGLVSDFPFASVVFQSSMWGFVNRIAQANTTLSSWSNTLSIKNSWAHNFTGVGVNYAQAQKVEVSDTIFQNNFSEVFRLISSSARMKNITFYTRQGMLVVPNLIATTTANQTKEILIDGLTTNTPYIPFTFSSSYPVKVMRYNSADDHRIYYGSQAPAPSFALSSTTPVGLVRSETGVDRYTPSGIAWKFSPLNTYITEFTPLEIPLTRLYIDTINSMTVSVWAKRDNVGIFGRLILPANQAGAPSTDVKTDFVAAAGSYVQISITFTPILANVILDIYFRVWGGTSFNFWVDEVVVS